ncbi:molybdopterin biosynthesis [Trichoderma arundinaceum]|uniref:molybdopterin adenylyltransferase n=1 Tax=Trichoderma arundinaceum TaxID=490622 RepID=A0A395NV53_TRIAR|nr:molybdopterin biosynthesis [Trichoderma arundinaceum]
MSPSAGSVETWLIAIKKLQHAANETRDRWICNQPGERVPLKDAVGRIALTDCISPECTPQFDTSAMDGFAVSSLATKDASLTHPVQFRVIGTITPGSGCLDDSGIAAYGMEPCAEIMTGGRFPDRAGPLGQLDACVRVEDITIAIYGNSNSMEQWRSIIVTKPVQPNAHRRIAGNDIQCSEVLVKAGQRISSSHIMPLSSLGFQDTEVMRKLRVGIWSTGNEFVTKSASIADVNGPFLQAASTEYGAEADFLGYLSDDVQSLSQSFHSHALSDKWDVLITSGAVSIGKFDFIRAALDGCGAKVIFHGLNIRPGHPVLFALINLGNSSLFPIFDN